MSRAALPHDREPVRRARRPIDDHFAVPKRSNGRHARAKAQPLIQNSQGRLACGDHFVAAAGNEDRGFRSTQKETMTRPTLQAVAEPGQEHRVRVRGGSQGSRNAGGGARV